MPKIDAKTVVEHRASREQQILEVATKLMRSTTSGELSLAAVAAEIGVTRTAIYKYFASAEELRARIVTDSFAAWRALVETEVSKAESPEEKVRTFAAVSLRLAGSGAHHAAMIAGADGSIGALNLDERHAELREPLSASLRELGVTNPEIEAELIDAAIGRGIELIDRGSDSGVVTTSILGLIDRSISVQPKKRERK